jgi:hypothetical protein
MPKSVMRVAVGGWLLVYYFMIIFQIIFEIFELIAYALFQMFSMSLIDLNL